MTITTPRTTATHQYQRAADRYGSQSAATASPARLLVMLYDRLVLDLTRARQAQLEQDRQSAHEHLSHAQDVVAELMSSLDVPAWEGGPALSRLYQWLMKEMIRANVRCDPQVTQNCLDVAEPLRDSWTEALAALPATPGTPAFGAGAGSWTNGTTG